MQYIICGFSLQDLHTVDLEEFKYGGTNITAFRLVDPESPEVQKVLRELVSTQLPILT